MNRQEYQELRSLWAERVKETSADLKRYGEHDRAWKNNFTALHALCILDAMTVVDDGGSQSLL